jgi:hypothetical protein
LSAALTGRFLGTETLVSALTLSGHRLRVRNQVLSSRSTQATYSRDSPTESGVFGSSTGLRSRRSAAAVRAERPGTNDLDRGEDRLVLLAAEKAGVRIQVGAAAASAQWPEGLTRWGVTPGGILRWSGRSILGSLSDADGRARTAGRTIDRSTASLLTACPVACRHRETGRRLWPVVEVGGPRAHRKTSRVKWRTSGRCGARHLLPPAAGRLLDVVAWTVQSSPRSRLVLREPHPGDQHPGDHRTRQRLHHGECGSRADPPARVRGDRLMRTRPRAVARRRASSPRPLARVPPQ